MAKDLTSSDIRGLLSTIPGSLSEVERHSSDKLKFSGCLAEQFLSEAVRARLFDWIGAEKLATLPVVRSTEAANY